MKNSNELWNLSFEIESLLLNMNSRDEAVVERVLPILDEKVKEFNTLYEAYRNISAPVDVVEEPETETDEIPVETVNPVPVVEVAIPQPEEKEEVVVIETPEPEVVHEHKKSIRSCFTLNDKFLFTRELFGGSSEQYSQALSLIEMMPDADTAEDYFVSEQGWNPEDGNVRQFFESIRKYFI